MIKRNIAVSKETREKIARIFGVSERTVWNALNLDYPGTEVTTRIRIAAKENGGVVMATIPAGEAIHFADGTMRMDFENGAVVEFHRQDGSGHIFFKGSEVARFKNVTVPMIYEIREQASAIQEVAQSL